MHSQAKPFKYPLSSEGGLGKSEKLPVDLSNEERCDLAQKGAVRTMFGSTSVEGYRNGAISLALFSGVSGMVTK